MARRAAVKRTRRRKPPKPPGQSALDKAKVILRVTGKEVYDGRIDQRRFKNSVVVDGVRHTRREIITMAQAVLDREWRRNNELRSQYGLSALARVNLRARK